MTYNDNDRGPQSRTSVFLRWQKNEEIENVRIDLCSLQPMSLSQKSPRNSTQSKSSRGNAKLNLTWRKLHGAMRRIVVQRNETTGRTRK